ncbi:MAG: glycosyltransferase [Candidatus Omnitrophota bacterium]
MKMLKSFYNNSTLLNTIRYKITPFMIEKKKGALLFDDSRFYRLNLNCRGDAYYGYVNIEDTRTKGRVFVARMDRLPFGKNNVKFIISDLEAINTKKYDLENVFREWTRVMVLNSVLTLDNFNMDRDRKVLGMLKKAGFEFICKDSKGLLPIAHFLCSPKDVKSSVDVSGILERSKKESNIVIKNILECLNPVDMLKFLQELFDSINENTIVDIFVKIETLEEDGRLLNFFDKSNLVHILRGIGFSLEKLETKDGLIKATLTKHIKISKLATKTEVKKRVCCIEHYLMFRNTHLGFDEDGLPLAFEKLGYDCFSIDGMRNINHKVIQDAILSYKPKYIVTRLKEVLPVLFDIKKELREAGTKVLFWFTDPTLPSDVDLRGVVDVMFLSNAGLIEEYKKIFKLDRVYFMAQSYMPYVFHRMDVPQEHDVAFTGALSKASVHSTRRVLLEKLKERYKVSIRNNVRSNVVEFYTRSKFVFGVSDFPYLYYTSNRFFIAMGCGSVYLTKRFSGIERFARNKEHILWFESELEMFDLIDYYLKHDKEREEIGKNAQCLAEEKHTTAHRVQNMIDIAEGKTDKFYGFLD